MGYHGHMNERRLPNGHLLVQLPTESDDGTMGDGLTEIGPEHPAFPTWDRWLKDHDQRSKRT